MKDEELNKLKAKAKELILIKKWFKDMRERGHVEYTWKQAIEHAKTL